MQSTPDTTTMSADVRDLQIVSTTFNKKEIGGTQVSHIHFIFILPILKMFKTFNHISFLEFMN